MSHIVAGNFLTCSFTQNRGTACSLTLGLTSTMAGDVGDRLRAEQNWSLWSLRRTDLPTTSHLLLEPPCPPLLLLLLLLATKRKPPSVIIAMCGAGNAIKTTRTPPRSRWARTWRRRWRWGRIAACTRWPGHAQCTLPRHGKAASTTVLRNQIPPKRNRLIIIAIVEDAPDLWRQVCVIQNSYSCCQIDVEDTFDRGADPYPALIQASLWDEVSNLKKRSFRTIPRSCARRGWRSQGVWTSAVSCAAIFASTNNLFPICRTDIQGALIWNLGTLQDWFA